MLIKATETRDNQPKHFPCYIIGQMSQRAVIAKYSQMKGQYSSLRTCWEGDGPWLYEKPLTLQSSVLNPSFHYFKSNSPFRFNVQQTGNFSDCLAVNGPLFTTQRRKTFKHGRQMKKPELTKPSVREGLESGDRLRQLLTDEWEKSKEGMRKTRNRGRKRHWANVKGLTRMALCRPASFSIYFPFLPPVSTLWTWDTWGNLLTRPNRVRWLPPCPFSLMRIVHMPQFCFFFTWKREKKHKKGVWIQNVHCPPGSLNSFWSMWDKSTAWLVILAALWDLDSA